MVGAIVCRESRGGSGRMARGREVTGWVLLLLLASAVALSGAGIGGGRAAAATDTPVRIMPVGDSVTSGGTHAEDTYRYRLYRHYAAAGVDWRPVGPFDGVHWEDREPSVGYEAWPREYTRHAGRNGWDIREIADVLTGWVADADPDVILALPAFARQDAATQADFEAFVDAARAGRADVKILFGLPYDGTPNSPAVTARYRARLAAAAAVKDSARAPVRLVDLGVGWDEDHHGSSYLGRYPSEPLGNERVAMRWADALDRYWGIGTPWPPAGRPNVDVGDAGLSWAFDDAADEWEVERDGEVVARVPSGPDGVQAHATTAPGVYRVRGIRSTATPDAPGSVAGPWSEPVRLGPDPVPTDACPRERVPVAPFGDVAGNVHRDSIDCVVWYGIAHGRTADTYQPSGSVRRDQMASFLARLVEEAGVELPVPGSDRFTDIAGSVHRDRINQLATAGLVEGTGAGTYRPEEPVRRDQMATFVVRAYEYIDGQPLPEAPPVFPDTAGNAHEASIGRAAEAGFTSGRADGTYGPRASVRRDQMATFLANVLRRLVEDGRVQPPE